MRLNLKNPHSVLAALEVRPGDVLEVQLGTRSPRGAWADVAERAVAAGVPVRRGESGSRRRGSGHDGGRSGAAVGIVSRRPGVDLEHLFVTAKDTPGTWLALDQVQDPHNVGAIFRTAAFYGVRGVVMTKNQSATLTGTVYDVASGGLEHVPHCVVPNLHRALGLARDAGLWVLGTSERGEEDLSAIDRERNWLVVIGNEERGLRRLTLESCDAISRIVPRGPLDSLNASVATAIVLATLCDPPANQ